MDLHKTAEGLSCSWAGVVTQGSLNSKLYHRTSCVSQHGHKWHFWWDISPYGTVLFIVGTFSTVSLSHQKAGEVPIILEEDSKHYCTFANTPGHGGWEWGRSPGGEPVFGGQGHSILPRPSSPYLRSVLPMPLAAQGRISVGGEPC